MLFLGIDGGGTKTEFILCDELGKVLSRVEMESASHWQVSADKIESIINEGLSRIMTEAHKTVKELTAIGYGMSGYGEDLNKDATTIGICRKVFEGRPLVVRNDGEIGLIASHGGNTGINVVAGTGSIAFGIDGNDTVARAGGWGHQVGDEGSGYWLGLKLLELFAKQSDGRLDRTLLYELTKAELDFDNDFELMTIVEDKYFGDRTKIASLQKILCKAASAGDECAVKAYEDAVEELLSLVTCVNRQLDLSEEVRVSYSGGIFKAGDFVTKPFIHGLNEKGFIGCEPLLEPIYGALILAAKEVGYHKEIAEYIISKGTQN